MARWQRVVSGPKFPHNHRSARTLWADAADAQTSETRMTDLAPRVSEVARCMYPPNIVRRSRHFTVPVARTQSQQQSRHRPLDGRGKTAAITGRRLIVFAEGLC